jgi:hypothetical protein
VATILSPPAVVISISALMGPPLIAVTWPLNTLRALIDMMISFIDISQPA